MLNELVVCKTGLQALVSMGLLDLNADCIRHAFPLLIMMRCIISASLN